MIGGVVHLQAQRPAQHPTAAAAATAARQTATAACRAPPVTLRCTSTEYGRTSVCFPSTASSSARRWRLTPEGKRVGGWPEPCGEGLHSACTSISIGRVPSRTTAGREGERPREEVVRWRWRWRCGALWMRWAKCAFQALPAASPHRMAAAKAAPPLQQRSFHACSSSGRRLCAQSSRGYRYCHYRRCYCRYRPRAPATAEDTLGARSRSDRKMEEGSGTT